MLEFEWDAQKALQNELKHRVSFDEASTVFANPAAKTVWDEDHSKNELREIIIGHSDRNRLLFVGLSAMVESRSSLPGGQRKWNDWTMKKKPSTKIKGRRDDDDLRPEYRIDYSKARPNRFADQYQAGSRVVVLAPDVAQVFTSTESVNVALRALISAIPSRTRKSS